MVAPQGAYIGGRGPVPPRRRPFLLAALAAGVVGAAIVLGTVVIRFRAMPPNIPIGFDVSPVGHQLAFIGAGNGGSDLYLLDLDTWKVTQLTNSPTWESSPAFSADGRSIVYCESRSEDEPSHIASYSLVTGRSTALTHPAPPSTDTLPACSRDSRAIAFVRTAKQPVLFFGGTGNDGYDLYTVRSDGSNLKRVTSNHYFDLTSVFFADNDRKLVFCSNRPESSDLDSYMFSIPDSGGAAPTLIRTPATGSIAVSPAGDIFVLVPYWEDRGSNGFQIVKADGQPIRHLPVAGYNPRFSPDGKSIYYLRTTLDDDTLISVVGTDGATVKEIANAALFRHPLQWKHR